MGALTATSRTPRLALPASVSTVAGTSALGFSGDGGLATQAMLNEPWDVALTPSGDVLVADKGNARVRRISASGIITTVAGIGTCPANDNNKKNKCVLAGEVPSITYLTKLCVYRCPNGSTLRIPTYIGWCAAAIPTN